MTSRFWQLVQALTIYQFIKPFLDNKMSIFEEYGAFKYVNLYQQSGSSNLTGLKFEILIYSAWQGLRQIW